MLCSLARRISDQFLPEVFYDPTFAVADGSPQRSLEDKKDLVMRLNLKMHDVLAKKHKGEEGSDKEGSEDER